jgi:hypothetical protein
MVSLFTDFLYSLSGVNLLKGFGTCTALGMTLHEGKVTATTRGVNILPLDTSGKNTQCCSWEYKGAWNNDNSIFLKHTVEVLVRKLSCAKFK